ncbi:MAG: GLPGLI family protein [Flavobacteriaceae bacterium]|nr:GLPGLI family protein [Flavobacteriaceae bacterium]
MNKTIIIFIYLFLASTNIFFAQKNKICGEIQYKQVKNISKIIEQDFLMKFNNKESYSEEVNVKLSNDSKESKVSERGLTETTIIGRKNLSPDFFYNNKTDFYFSDHLGSKTLFIKEDYYDWKWKLHEETKKIGKFTCQKATIKFRGRNYIAWFTNKIPVPYGPWKFKDLPGLILEVYDTDNIFHITTNKIKIRKMVDCSIKFERKQLKSTMSIIKYRKKKEEFVNSIFAKLSSKMPKGTPALKWNKNCEDCPKGLEIFDEEN